MGQPGDVRLWRLPYGNDGEHEPGIFSQFARPRIDFQLHRAGRHGPPSASRRNRRPAPRPRPSRLHDLRDDSSRVAGRRLLAAGRGRGGDLLRLRRQKCPVSAARLVARRDGRADAGLRLVHSATMVAAGVYLVGRFYPVFAPEVLLVIAYVGCITLFMAATIAITATDIKRVLAYSTVSQLGYMMLALGVGGWVAGIVPPGHARVLQEPAVHVLGLGDPCHAHQRHAAHGRPAAQDALDRLHDAGRLLAISAPASRSSIGFSGYYSKDAIVAQALSFYDAAIRSTAGCSSPGRRRGRRSRRSTCSGCGS